MPELHPPPPGGSLDSPELTRQMLGLALFYVDRALLGVADFRLRAFIERAAWELRQGQQLGPWTPRQPTAKDPTE